ncbi:MAG: hypothetical protein ABID32_02100 [Candidatus Omnitrophota bacterium]
MRNILLALIVIAFLSSLCFAEELSAKTDEAKTFIGKIESIVKSIVKSPKWTYARITVVDDSGRKMMFFCIKETAVFSASGKDLTADGTIFGAVFLKKGERIVVEYSVVDKNRNDAISISCID